MRMVALIGLLALGVAPAVAVAPAPQTPAPKGTDKDEIVVTGRRTGPLLSGGEWVFEHSPIAVRNIVPSGQGMVGADTRTAFAQSPTVVASANRWRFCLPDSSVEDLVTLLLSRGANNSDMGNCSRTRVEVTKDKVQSLRSCFVTYYPPAAADTWPPPRPIPANRQFRTTGRYDAEKLWLRFESEVRLTGEGSPVQSMRSTMTARRTGSCPAK